MSPQIVTSPNWLVTPTVDSFPYQEEKYEHLNTFHFAIYAPGDGIKGAELILVRISLVRSYYSTLLGYDYLMEPYVQVIRIFWNLPSRSKQALGASLHSMANRIDASTDNTSASCYHEDSV